MANNPSGRQSESRRRIMVSLAMRVGYLHLILHSKQQIALCAHKASPRTKIAVQCISLREIAAGSAEIPRATESTYARQWACEKERRHVAADRMRDLREA